jgi:hypothetical protein
MAHYLFPRTPAPKVKNVSPNDALVLPAGADALKELTLPGVDDVEDAEQWGKVFAEAFGASTLAPGEGAEAPPLDPAGKFGEQSVDEALRLREEDLRLYREAQSRERADARRAAAPPPGARAPARKPSSRDATKPSARDAPKPAAAPKA